MDPSLRALLPVRKIPRKLMSKPNGMWAGGRAARAGTACRGRRPNAGQPLATDPGACAGVGIDRIVVFVDPGNDDEEYWRPAMVVPTVEWDETMGRVKPGECIVRYFDDNSL